MAETEYAERSLSSLQIRLNSLLLIFIILCSKSAIYDNISCVFPQIVKCYDI
jgi:hypothetical protein